MYSRGIKSLVRTLLLVLKPRRTNPVQNKEVEFLRTSKHLKFETPRLLCGKLTPHGLKLLHVQLKYVKPWSSSIFKAEGILKH